MRLVNIRTLLAAVLLFASFRLAAWTIDDIHLPDGVDIAATNLQLNGAGYRTKFIFKLYVGGLYLPQKAHSRDEVQAMSGVKRVLMHMVYDEISREKMAAAWREGFEDNTSDKQYAALKDRLDKFIAMFPDLKAGDIVYLDYLPGKGTQLMVNQEIKGVIEGEDFYVALLDVWLGEDPADEDLKAAMLGQQDD